MKVEFTLNNTKYTTVNSFKSNNRKTSNCEYLAAFYVDLDIYNSAFLMEKLKYLDEELLDDFSNFSELLQKQHNEIINQIFKICKLNDIPKPSRINFSGRGYNAFWEIQPKNDGFIGASPALIPIYKQIQQLLVSKFEKLGADSKAVDVSRVFKKEGELNLKSNLSCEQVSKCNTRVDFTTFCNSLFLYSKKEVENFKNEKITKKQLKLCDDLGIVDVDNLTKEEAKYLISSNLDNSKSQNWLLPYLLKIQKKLPRKGSNSNFCYLFGIALKGKSEKTINYYIDKLSKSLYTDLQQIKNDVNSGLKANATYLSKKRINEILSLDTQVPESNNFKKKKKYTSSTIFLKNYNVFLAKYNNKELSKLFNLSLSTIKRCKKIYKKIIYKNKQNKQEFEMFVDSIIIQNNQCVNDVVDIFEKNHKKDTFEMYYNKKE